MASVTGQDSAPPPKPQRKTPAQTLVRVRNNQRRHRARRREYIASLEQKLQLTERLLSQSEADVVALKAELRKFRKNGSRPCSAGSKASKSGQDNTADPPTVFPVEQQSPEAEEQQSSRVDELQETSPVAPYSEAATQTGLLTSVAAPDSPQTMSTSVDGSMTDESVSTLSVVPLRKASPTLVAVQLASPLNNVLPGPPPRSCPPVNDPPMMAFVGIASNSSSIPKSSDVTILPSACHTYPPSDFESTTLCSQANILIAQQNFRGSSASTIRSWLHQGFRQANAHDEGCRVENKLLFGLLDFISGA